MEGAFKSWPSFYQEVHRHLQPRGMVEVVGQDLSATSNQPGVATPDAILKWQEVYHTLMDQRGYGIMKAEQHRAMLEKAGFEGVRKQEITVPLGNWAKDKRLKKAGSLYLASVLDAFESYGLKLLMDSGWKREEVDILKGQVTTAFTDMSTQLYANIFIVSGHKQGIVSD